MDIDYGDRHMASDFYDIYIYIYAIFAKMISIQFKYN